MSKLKLLELFSGIQAQERALRQLPIEYESVGVCDCDKDVLVSAAAMRFNLEEEIKNFNFPSQDKMIEYLQNKDIGYSFEKNKHTITSRTPITKLKQYYIADNLLKNLGDISKVERLPYADLVTYSSPCQSFSVAGKLAGAKKICKVCGHEWEIDFSNPNYNYKCPHCGSVNLESTTSGLLQEVQRLLSVAYENNELPKYLLLENVKNLVGKKFKPQFDAWIRWLDSIGYNTYYQVLNSKNFGIPQNRERIFALSIRKDVDNGNFKFPEQIPLTTRLKDILEKTVDEKYYLSGNKVESILTNFIARQNEASGINLKDQATTFDGLTDIAHTLMARDYKGFGNQSMTGVIEPSIIKVGQLDSSFDQSGRVYSAEGIASTVMSNSHGKTSGGYTSPKILVDENSDKLIKVEVPQTVNVRKYEVDIDALQKLLRDAKFKSSFTNKDIAEKLDQSLTTVEHWFRTDECFSIPSPDVWMNLKELLNITIDEFDESITTFEERLGVFEKSNRCYLENGISPTITCGQNEKIIVSENVEPKVIKIGNIYPSNGENGNIYDVSGLSPTLKAGTGVKGNGIGSNNAPKVVEPFIVASRGRNPENPSDRTTGSPTEQRLEANMNGTTNTITTVAKDNYVMEPQIIQKFGDRGTSQYSIRDYAHTIPANPMSDRGQMVMEPVVCEQRCDEGLRFFKDDVVGTLRTIDACGDKRVIEPEDINPVRIGNIYGEQFGTGYAGNVWDQDSVSPTIMTAQGGNRQPLVVDNVKWRIRKLTPLECWRLMSFSDEDCNRASKYVSDSSLYKQAGNSIVTSCLVAIFYSLLFNDSSTKWSDYIVQYKINGGNE